MSRAVAQLTACNLLSCWKLFVFDHNCSKMFLFGRDQIAQSESAVEKFLRTFPTIPKPFPRIIFGVEHMRCNVQYYGVRVKYMNIYL